MASRDVVSNIASVPTNVFTTVVSVPQGTAVEVFGYSALREIPGPTVGVAFPFSVRLVIAGSTEHLFVSRDDGVPWLNFDALPTRNGSVLVQVLHNQVTDQLFRAFVGILRP